jgi:hypothetical protein
MLRIVAALLLASPAFAEEVGQLGGLPVQLNGDFGEMTLKVGDMDVITDYSLEIEGISDIQGVPTLVGFAFSGGNACEGSNFIVALVDGKPRLDGPIEVCGPTNFEGDESGIFFTTDAMPGQDGQSWNWSPTDGLTEGDPVAFAPDTALGWNELAAEMPTHPFDILYFAEIAAQIDALLGPNLSTYLERVEGLGSGDMHGEDFFGTACIKFSCEEDAAMMYLDASEKKVFLAWTTARQELPVMAPAEPEWTDDARRAYVEWLRN